MNRLSDICVVSLNDPAYPENLKQIPNPPEKLYFRGTLLPNEKLFTVVGTRKPSAYGIECAKYFVSQLVNYGFSIVSGLALGLDAVCHRAALDSGGRTLAVLGSGVDVITPITNEHLGLEIIKQGALISEFAPGTQPQKFHFPQRDRIMAGLSCGTLVIEAGGKSGALITAYAATEQGREVFAVPGDIFSFGTKGTHQLIQEGAKLVLDIDDILEELSQLKLQPNLEKGITNANTPASLSLGGPTSPDSAAILNALSRAKTLEELLIDTQLEIGQLRSELTTLEIRKIIRRRLDGRYQLNK